jgi:cytochrome c oxidase subunit 2
VAKRFVFTPGEIVLKKGQPVVFELTTQDFGHGFRIPDSTSAPTSYPIR